MLLRISSVSDAQSLSRHRRREDTCIEGTNLRFLVRKEAKRTGAGTSTAAKLGLESKNQSHSSSSTTERMPCGMQPVFE